MREIYASPRPENIDRMVALLDEHGIETRVYNRSRWKKPGYKRFSYVSGNNRARWAQVEVIHADDMPQARQLLRDIGIGPVTRHAEVLEISRAPRRGRRRMATASRIRMLALVAVSVAMVVLILRMAGVY